MSPTGGVIIPISKFTVMMMPTCTGSMPRAMATGNRLGARFRMMDDGSMKLPATSNRMLTMIRKPTDPNPMLPIQSAMPCGICSDVRTKLNKMALAMIQ